MRKQWELLRFVLGGTDGLKFSRQCLSYVGSNLERFSLPAQPRLDSEPQMVQMTISSNHYEWHKLNFEVSAVQIRNTRHSNELSRSKLVPKVVPPADKIATSRQESYALSWKPCQGDSLNLPDHRIHKDGDGDASFQLESDSLPHAHAQTTKTYYKHQDSRIMKAQECRQKTSEPNSDIQDLPSKISSLSREIVSKLSR
ncbi:hypothetical protein Tco_1503606 [Tanacetum coccineum]